MNGIDTYVIRATSADGVVKYYTGRTGEGWLDSSIQNAFGYQSLEGARRKALVLNRMMDVHGWRFSVPWIRDLMIAGAA